MHFATMLALRLTHKSRWIVDIGANLSVNFNVTLHKNLCDLGVGQCVLQTITKENH